VDDPDERPGAKIPRTASSAIPDPLRGRFREILVSPICPTSPLSYKPAAPAGKTGDDGETNRRKIQEARPMETGRAFLVRKMNLPRVPSAQATWLAL
jgi:hypothetical protein